MSIALDEFDDVPSEKQSVPFEQEDLLPELRALKGWRLVKAMHDSACDCGRDTYIDPASGYSVFTSRLISVSNLKNACSSRDHLPVLKRLQNCCASRQKPDAEPYLKLLRASKILCHEKDIQTHQSVTDTLQTFSVS